MDPLVWWIPGAFAVGSVPFGLIIGKLNGVDIRTRGSGNIGATNVWRELGWKAGLPCFILDVAKGLAPTLLAGLSAGLLDVQDGVPPPTHAWLWLCVMVASVLGHIFSPWVGFKGGKGVATGLGALLGLYPVLTIAGAAALLVWITLTKATRYVGLSSSVAAGMLPIVSAAELWRRGALDERAVPYLVVTALLAGLVIYRHRGNLARTLKGTEPRIGDPRPKAPEGS
ncbi:MAG: glycerol-3-phosphate 1-O-acyltransferase PlsY [Planctomycetota bacterium]